MIQDESSNETPDAPAENAAAVEALPLTVERKAELFDKLAALPAGSVIVFTPSRLYVGEVDVQIRKQTALIPPSLTL